jgi:uncharacterized protein (TIGR00299 family) protein
MPSLLIEMPSGVAGDMLLAALLDLGGDQERMQNDLLALGLGAIAITQSRVMRSGLTSVLVAVQADQEARWRQSAPAHAKLIAITLPRTGTSPGTPPENVHHKHGSACLTGAPVQAHQHRPYAVIRDLIAASALPERVRERAQRVFRTLAVAEASVHGVDPDQVEFHEVGAVDAIADVVGCCLLLEQLGITRIISGPIMPGNGSVSCAHGRMPVPVPAVAAMLSIGGAPWRHRSDDTGELTTPTGCALVIALTDAFVAAGALPTFRSLRVGYGAGHKDLPSGPNLVRLSLIDEIDPATATHDSITELRCAMDDATGEALGILITDLLDDGCKDAYLAPLIMKKGRPGFELTVLCDPQDEVRITKRLLTCSSSIGVRSRRVDRVLLPRTSDIVTVEGLQISCKVVTLPDGTRRAKPEADDVQTAARTLGRTFTSVQQQAVHAWASSAQQR